MFVSYAQNFEDVMLHRALRDVEHGFYVDVGANDPIQDSVTKAFYERGWSGINVEPVLAWHERLSADRPRDINLCTAISSRAGTIPFFAFVATGRSTSLRGVANEAAALGHPFCETSVPTRTLDSILEEHARGEIHFLKIDVEGVEREVLETIDLARTRPWIVVVESTTPGTNLPNYQDWEPLVTGRDYVFAYFDGLNRFYVATEHSELVERFLVPPNFFDIFVRHSERDALERVQRLDAELEAASARLGELVTERDALSDRVTGIDNDLASARARLESVSNELERARSDAEDLVRKNEVTSARIGELRQANEAAQHRIAELADVRATMQREAEALAVQLTEAENRFAEVSERHQAAERRVNALTLECDEIRAAVRATNARAAMLAAEVVSAQRMIETSEERVLRTEMERDAARAIVDDLHRRLDHWWNVAEAGQHELRVIRGSRSWRLTAPLRSANEVLKRALRPALDRTIGYVLARPRLKAAAFRALRFFPGLHARLRRFAIARGLLPAEVAGVVAESALVSRRDEVDLSSRTLRAQRLYDALLAARKNDRGKPA